MRGADSAGGVPHLGPSGNWKSCHVEDEKCRPGWSGSKPCICARMAKVRSELQAIGYGRAAGSSSPLSV